MEGEPDGVQYQNEEPMEADEPEEVESDEKSLDYEDIRTIIEAPVVENDSDPTMIHARKQLFITKGTPLHQTLMDIKTGEQAISFFAKHGNNTPIKFVNCNRA